jgi:hypothetical protein
MPNERQSEDNWKLHIMFLSDSIDISIKPKPILLVPLMHLRGADFATSKTSKSKLE